MAPKKSPSRKSPVRSPRLVREAESVINAVDYYPTKEVFMVMNYLSLVLVLLGLASGIAWIYYVAKAQDNPDTDDGKSGDVFGTDKGKVVKTSTMCFQALVVSVLLYFVARHHYSHSA